MLGQTALLHWALDTGSQAGDAHLLAGETQRGGELLVRAPHGDMSQGSPACTAQETLKSSSLVP